MFLRKSLVFGIAAMFLALGSAGARGAVITVDRTVRIGDIQWSRSVIQPLDPLPGKIYTDTLFVPDASEKSVVVRGGDTVQFTLTMDSPMRVDVDQLTKTLGASFGMRQAIPPKGPQTTVLSADPVIWIDSRYIDPLSSSAQLSLSSDPAGNSVVTHGSVSTLPDVWIQIYRPGVVRGFSGSFTLPADYPQTQFDDFYFEMTGSVRATFEPRQLMRVAVPEPASLGVMALACGGLLLRRRQRIG